MTLWVDDRWRGSHGIGRYAEEVLARLDTPWTSLELDGRPSSPLDALRKLPAERSDLVYSPGYNVFRAPVRQIVTVFDLIHLQAAWPGRAKYLAYYNALVRPVVKRAGIVFTCSETSRRVIEEWLDDESARVVNTSLGCSAEFSLAGEAFESPEPYVVFVGNLRPHKNFDTLLAAVAKSTGWMLHAVIPRGELDRANALAADVGIASRVQFHHGIDDAGLARLYRGAAATVCPSTLEGFGLPALESLRCGTPVVYWSGCETIAETVGDQGVVIDDPLDALAWRDAIMALIASPGTAMPPPGYDWDETARIVDKVLLGAGKNRE